MIDPRFYERLGPVAAGRLATQCEVRGGADRPITGAAALQDARPEDVAFFQGRLAADAAPPRTAAGAIFVAPAAAEHFAATGATLLVTAHPRAAFARALGLLVRERGFPAGAERIDPSAQIEPGVTLDPGVVIGADARIGAGAHIGPNAVIGPGVCIGRRTRIGPNVVASFALIGDDVAILGGAVIGQSGFGVAPSPTGPVDVPQIGRAIIMDRVTIGACSTVDRGAFGDTVVGEDVKIDNHCHIAHNVLVGRGVVMAGYAGISGSVRIGDFAMLGGRVGVADHRTVGAGANVAAGSGVLDDVPAGATWGGYPAKPLRRWVREGAWLSKAAAGRKDAGT
jgi:UDP-3-O-[3-hydroxymyristoyl] glucosamine N-acyltransferase